MNNPTLILLGFGLLLWWLNRRGQSRQVELLSQATAPQATNGLPQNAGLAPSRPSTIKEMGDLVVQKLKERTI